MAIRIKYTGKPIKHYSFSAKSLAKASEKMKSHGPLDGNGIRRHAIVDWSADILSKGAKINIVKGSEKKAPGGGWTAKAQIEKMTLQFKITIIFPRWTNVEGHPKPVKTEWSRYAKCLMDHENGHKKIVVKAAEMVQKQFENLITQGKGTDKKAARKNALENLQPEGNKIFTDVIIQAKTDNALYDIKTNHGETQGARLKVKKIRGSRH